MGNNMSNYSDLNLLEAETTFYESVRSLAEKQALLQEYVHLMNFTDETQQAVNFRKSFHLLLQANATINTKLLEFFELICQQHNCTYKD